MKVAIMQPYFFPYIGYFQLMSHAELWVVFDQVQFVNKGWINRNRILHNQHEKEWQYITLPIAQRHRQSKICDLHIANHQKWRENILGKLTIYRRQAPHYQATINFITECFASEADNLSDFLIHLLARTVDYLEIETPFVLQSELNLDKDLINHPGDWALMIAKALNADEYINLPGGFRLFDEDKFLNNGIKLNFIQPNLTKYQQFGHHFVGGLSIIDLLMWNSLSEIRDMLKNDYRITSFSEILAAEENQCGTNANASE
jgi:hypothetical protein